MILLSEQCEELETMRALIVIDYTVDFVTGKLPCGQPAIDIENRIAELAVSFAEKGDFVVMAVDLHEENDPYHPESRLFPPHNIRGTTGRELYGKLEAVYERHQETIYWMDKTRYSAFSGTDLELRLRARGIRELHLIGVCTDICVLHTAVDAYNRGFEVTVHADAVASFNQDGHEWALGHFQNTLGFALMKDGQPFTV
jgi:nicotinamidase-related amidase